MKIADYEMFTAKGNAAVDGVVKTAMAALENGVDTDTVTTIVNSALANIGEEATDTAVEEAVFDKINLSYQLMLNQLEEAI